VVNSTNYETVPNACPSERRQTLVCGGKAGLIRSPLRVAIYEATRC
jgi:hypothetical protein